MTKHLLLGSGGQRLYLSSSGVDSACKAEVSKKLGLKQVSLLLDLTCFYDLVDHNLLAEDALSLGFPPLVLFLCLQVHKGPRYCKLKMW